MTAEQFAVHFTSIQCWRWHVLYIYLSNSDNTPINLHNVGILYGNKFNEASLRVPRLQIYNKNKANGNKALDNARIWNWPVLQVVLLYWLLKVQERLFCQTLAQINPPPYFVYSILFKYLVLYLVFQLGIIKAVCMQCHFFNHIWSRRFNRYQKC